MTRRRPLNKVGGIVGVDAGTRKWSSVSLGSTAWQHRVVGLLNQNVGCMMVGNWSFKLERVSVSS